MTALAQNSNTMLSCIGADRVRVGGLTIASLSSVPVPALALLASGFRTTTPRGGLVEATEDSEADAALKAMAKRAASATQQRFDRDVVGGMSLTMAVEQAFGGGGFNGITVPRHAAGRAPAGHFPMSLSLAQRRVTPQDARELFAVLDLARSRGLSQRTMHVTVRRAITMRFLRFNWSSLAWLAQGGSHESRPVGSLRRVVERYLLEHVACWGMLLRGLGRDAHGGGVRVEAGLATLLLRPQPRGDKNPWGVFPLLFDSRRWGGASASASPLGGWALDAPVPPDTASQECLAAFCAGPADETRQSVLTPAELNIVRRFPATCKVTRGDGTDRLSSNEDAFLKHHAAHAKPPDDGHSVAFSLMPPPQLELGHLR